MPSDTGPLADPTKNAKPNRKHRWLLYSLWSAAGVGFGIVLVALTNSAVIWSSSDQFCGQFCHSMTWASAAYKRGPHFIDQVGVSASCGDCHVPYDSQHATPIEYVQLLGFKAQRGAKDFYNEARKTIATKEEWEQRRPALRTGVENYLTAHNYATCLGCHRLDSFGGPRSQMKKMIHRDVIKAGNVDCLACHRNIGHVYQTSAKTSAWYTVQQAAAGGAIYQHSCSSCHGANLQGGSGPALTGSSWQQLYGGAKLLTPWGEIKGPMAEDAGANFTTQQALDILAFLLQNNGYPAGRFPLTDTRQLSDVIPSN
jgi:nitrate/TMAO reductase-like tetraheme cytochrome c subunit